MSFEIKFSFLKCVATLSLVPILKPFWSRLVKLFETVTPPSKRMAFFFPYNSLYVQAVAYTTYFELGEPVDHLSQFCFQRTIVF